MKVSKLFHPSSLAVRHHLRTRDDDHPADDVSDGQVPRHPQQRPGVHEAARSTQGLVREGDGLRRLNLVHDQRHRPGEGEELNGLYQLIGGSTRGGSEW